LGDEGVGTHIYKELKGWFLPETVEVVDGGTGGLDILPLLEGVDKVILIDAVKGGRAGTIHHLKDEDLENVDLSVDSLHNIKLEHVLKIGRRLLGDRYPEVVIFGIEADRIGEFDLELTPEVKVTIPRVVHIESSPVLSFVKDRSY
jgi:hydrogenase maturation protease